MRDLEQSPARDAAIAAMLPHIPHYGWTINAIRVGLLAQGGSAAGSEWLFNGAADMIEAYADWADRRMARVADLAALPKISARVRALVACRFQQAAQEREAARRSTGVLALPTNAAVAARIIARTSDTIWHLAGDTAADWNWYTKRATLAAIYSATYLFWLRLDDEQDPDLGRTLAFFDRQLGGVVKLGSLRRRAGSMLRRGSARHPADPASAPG